MLVLDKLDMLREHECSQEEAVQLVFTIFRFGFAIIFICLHLALMIGLFLEWRRDSMAIELATRNSNSNPKVSVVIPVHNEAERMEGLLKSLAVQDYDNFEIILIDDRSDDETPNMLSDFAAALKDSTIAVHIMRLETNPGPNFKQFALGRGMEKASGEYLLFTDGDCIVPPHWIRSMSIRLSDEGVGAVLGPVFKKYQKKGFFFLYQSFDHAVRYMYLAASTGLGSAGGGFGNNLIVRKQALDAVGGYDSIPYSVTEDAALIASIRSHTSYKVRAACGYDVQVFTRSEPDWKSFVIQTLRWNNGGLFSPDMATRLNFAFLMLTISTGMLSIAMIPIVPLLWPLPVAVLMAMSMNTIAVLLLAGPALPKAGLAYLLQLFFTPTYFSFLTILGFLGISVSWKGNELKNRER